MQKTRILQHHYNALSQKWSKVQSEITIADQPFAEGAFRAAYSATMTWDGKEASHFVCKFAKDPTTPKSMYFNDVEAHEIATLYASKFNDHLPEMYPRIGYVSAFIVEFVDRPGRPVCGCEQLLEGGKFKKYNNNVGAVCAMSHEETLELNKTTSLVNWDPTSTAQAFSHFSWEHSQNQVLICDIQGVENRFTDPQIHTMSGKGFGLGNLGQTGIRAFLLRHTCNEICKAVGLQPIKAKDLNERQVQASFVASGGATNGLHSGPAPIPGSLSSKRPPHHSTGSSHTHHAQHQTQSDVLVINDSTTPPSQARSLSSSASTANISHAATQAVMRNAPYATSASASSSSTSLSHDRDRQQQDHHNASFQSLRSHQSSNRSTPAQSPQASPRTSLHNASSFLHGAPLRNTPAPAAAGSSTPVQPVLSPTPKGLDDSDEALMASIMGD